MWQIVNRVQPTTSFPFVRAHRSSAPATGITNLFHPIYHPSPTHHSSLISISRAMLPTTFARLASRAAQASPLKTQVRACDPSLDHPQLPICSYLL